MNAEAEESAECRHLRPKVSGGDITAGRVGFKCTMRAILLTLAWVGAAVGFYVALVVLEYYWNAWDWLPDLDLIGWGLLVGVFGFLVVMRLLASAARDRLSQAVSLVLCVALLGLGCYVVAPEPLTEGMLGRGHSSPFWYRFGRLGVLALPSVIWVRGLVVRKQRGGQPCAAPSGGAAHSASGSGSTTVPPGVT